MQFMLNHQLTLNFAKYDCDFFLPSFDYEVHKVHVLTGEINNIISFPEKK